MNLSSALRSAALATFAFAFGCSGQSPAADSMTASDEVTSVSHSPIRNQSIGNCWLYATAEWIESMHYNRAAEHIDISVSYLTYWDWFEKITTGSIVAPDGTPLDALHGGQGHNELEAGGFLPVGAAYIVRYGVVVGPDNFITNEPLTGPSTTQANALIAINRSLASGALSTVAARADRALVRRELNAAFQLPSNVVADLDKVFGPAVDKRLDIVGTSVIGTIVKRPQQIEIAVPNAKTDQPELMTLKAAFGKADVANPYKRDGEWAFQSATYPSDPTQQRAFLRRIQRALNDHYPVPVAWKVDWASMVGTTFPSFRPGHYAGGHETVLEDYEVTDVPGFGTLPAGVTETRPEALAAALDDSAKITFFRTKNQWGTGGRAGAFDGYYDLSMEYLNGSETFCALRGADGLCAQTWSTGTFLQEVILPAGF